LNAAGYLLAIPLFLLVIIIGKLFMGLWIEDNPGLIANKERIIKVA